MNKQFIIGSLAALWLVPAPLSAQSPVVLTVDSLFALVESGNADLRRAVAAVGVADAGVQAARSRRLPDVSVSLQATYNGNVLMTDRDFGNATGLSQPHFGNSFILEARQTVYAGGGIDAGVRLAEVQRRQAGADVEQTRAARRLMAVALYLDIYKADNGIRVYESNIELARRLLDDIKARLAEGMAISNDVTRYELQLETLRLRLRTLRDRRAVLNHRLCTALGLDGRTLVPDSAVVLAAYARGTETGWQERAAASSPVLRRSALGIEAAGEQLRIARSAMRPEVDVFAANNFSGPFTYDIPPVDKNFNVWFVGVGIRYSLSSLFKANKDVRRAKAAVELSRESHAVAAETLGDDVQEAYTDYMRTYADLATRQKNVELAAANYGVMTDRYKGQLALVTDMIDAANARLDAELSAADARADIAYAYYRMLYLAGEI